MDARGVWHMASGMQRGRQIVFRRQAQSKRAEGWIKAVVKGQSRHAVQKISRGLCPRCHHARQHILGQCAAGLPAVEGVSIMGKKEGAFGLRHVALQHYGGGKSAQDRRDGSRGKTCESKALHGLIHLKNGRSHHLIAIGVQQTDGNWNDLGILFVLPRGGRVGLGEGQRIGATLGRSRPRFMHRQVRGSGLRIP